jgi:hypothetical protein
LTTTTTEALAAYITSPEYSAWGPEPEPEVDEEPIASGGVV